MISVMQKFLNVMSGAIWKSPRWHLSIGIGIQVLSFAQYKLSLELKVILHILVKHIILSKVATYGLEDCHLLKMK